jgi:hypothetical protein
MTMKTKRILLYFLPFLISFSGWGKTHLLILSGQSNMAGLNPALSFTPTVKKLLAPDDVIVVKSAQGGQPIRRWYKDWKPAKGDTPKADGLLYDKLMEVVEKGVGDKKYDTVTFVWMQGERDAKERHGEVYEKSFAGLVKQLSGDLGRDDVNFVIGRLSDCLNKQPGNSHWMEVRKAQVAVAEKNPRGAWVDTDDLNGPKDGLHYNKEGYVELGKRFAEKAVELIHKAK